MIQKSGTIDLAGKFLRQSSGVLKYKQESILIEANFGVSRISVYVRYKSCWRMKITLVTLAL